MKRVLVLGAGPGGAAAARTLRDARGVEVVVVDKATFPRDKICAGGLSPKAQTVLGRLGVLDEVRREAQPIERLRLGGPEGEAWTLAKARSIVLPRRRFDHLLVSAARGGAVTLREGVRATGLLRHGGRVVGAATSEGELEADVVLVATGVQGLHPDLPAPRRLLAVERRYEGFDFDPRAMEMLYAKELLPGYGWVFPESDRRANVGVCVDESHPQAGRLHEVLARFLETHLGGRMDGAVAVDKARGQPIAWRRTLPTTGEPGVLWIGEALGLTSAATGEGIWHALASGEAAAEAVLAAATPEAAVTAYRSKLQARLGPSLFAAALFSDLASTSIFPRVVRAFDRGILGRAATRVLERL